MYKKQHRNYINYMDLKTYINNLRRYTITQFYKKKYDKKIFHYFDFEQSK